MVEQDDPVVLRELLPLVVPRGHVDAEAVCEHERGFGRVAGGPNVQQRAVLGEHRRDLLGRQLVVSLAGLGVGTAALPLRHHLARRDRGADGRGSAGHPQCPFPVHGAYLRGTRGPMPQTIS